MKSTPKFVRGAYCAAMRIALQEIVEGSEAQNEERQCRGWKLFLLLPRMLLFRPHLVEFSRSPDCWTGHRPVDAIVDFESGEFRGCEEGGHEKTANTCGQP